jgi:hypothetical protein
MTEVDLASAAHAVLDGYYAGRSRRRKRFFTNGSGNIAQSLTFGRWRAPPLSAAVVRRSDRNRRQGDDEEEAGCRDAGLPHPRRLQSGMAHQAIGMEPRVGAMLPCNVILREVRTAWRSAPSTRWHRCRRSTTPLQAVAGQVRDLLAKAVDAI